MSKSMRRALETKDAYRIGPNPPPLLVEATELVTPELAYQWLLKNTSNRPVGWKDVERYAEDMRQGRWVTHGQPIMFDADGKLMNGQRRLWAVIYSGTAIYMRISRGNPSQAARLIDRGTPQSARDLASRATGKRHSPTEAAIARASLVLRGRLKPTTDELADEIERQAPETTLLLQTVTGTKKTRAVLMLLAAICVNHGSSPRAIELAKEIDILSGELDRLLKPRDAAACWGKGAVFVFALERARDLTRT